MCSVLGSACFYYSPSLGIFSLPSCLTAPILSSTSFPLSLSDPHFFLRQNLWLFNIFTRIYLFLLVLCFQSWRRFQIVCPSPFSLSFYFLFPSFLPSFLLFLPSSFLLFLSFFLFLFSCVKNTYLRPSLLIDFKCTVLVTLGSVLYSRPLLFAHFVQLKVYTHWLVTPCL